MEELKLEVKKLERRETKQNDTIFLEVGENLYSLVAPCCESVEVTAG
ncbi:MAG: hypothetical protein SVM80_02900 [Halobacteriota archaeon]|nr:hypothetical protein [Halobacteriota archaeon]